MLLNLLRFDMQKSRTIGALYVDGKFECFTLEDAVRELGPNGEGKVAGETAIPAGYYRVVLESSPKFGPDTLTLLDVPHFTHIRVHAGNKEADTDGCPLVGWLLDAEAGLTFLGKSGVALKQLKGKVVPKIKASEECWIQIDEVGSRPCLA